MVRYTRCKFSDAVVLHQAENSLLLALLAAEGLFGASRLRLECDCLIDPSINVIAVETTSQVGYAVAAIFTAFVSRKFGPENFDVRTVEGLASHFGHEGDGL